MPQYSAPVDETLFILNDVLNIEKYNNLAGFADLDQSIIKAILQEGAKLCEEELFPVNQSGDEEGCTRHDDATVTTPEGFKEAYHKFCEGGWLGLSADPEYGGQGMPYALNAVINEYASAANMALAMYPGLTRGAIAALQKHATDELKTRYLPKMISGDWTGTMNLTEPHCGTDLGLLRTKAKENGDGSYAISGTKIFISAGEHDLSNNIIHLVLARIEGAPEGVKGISLFVVPKFLPDADNNPGERNTLECGAIEKKMGIHGNATCVMNYDDAQGWLIGEENGGLKAMFTMMNDARIGVGIQGLAQSEIAYQNALAYAKDRRQGRALTGASEPDEKADPIIVHPDVRRMLLNIKSFNEAARALVLWGALQSDISEVSEDEGQRQTADDLLGLLTPVIKGVLTDIGFANAVNAQQIFGGHGYIKEWGMDQYVRDARIAMIYEGANGIQALDLVGRKLPRNGGRALMAFFKEVDADLAAHKDDDDLKIFTDALKAARDDLEKATGWFMNNALAKPDNAGAGATDYMHLMGIVAMAWMWLKMAKAANSNLKDANGSADYYNAKISTGKFFAARIVPESSAHVARIISGADPVMELAADAF